MGNELIERVGKWLHPSAPDDECCEVRVGDLRELIAKARGEGDRVQEALSALKPHDIAYVRGIGGKGWKSLDRDNMELEGRVTCYVIDSCKRVANVVEALAS